MSTQKWEPLPQEVLDLRSSLEKGEQPAPSVASAIGLSMWTLMRSAGLETLQPLTQSITNGYPDVYRTLSTKRPSKGRWSSTIRQNWNGIIEDPDLPPIDGGRRAWLFMVGAFMVEGVMWGFPLTFGVFQAYYEKTAPFQGSQNLAIIGTLCTGVSYVAAPLITPLTIKYPGYQRHMIWGSWSICILALIGSSFATQLWHLVVTQGLLYGIGFQFIYYPILSMLNEWFDKKRGLAYGIMFGSAGICGLGLPFLVEKLLVKFGYALTLRAYALAIFVLVGPTLPLLRNRIPPEQIASSKIDRRVFSRPVFFTMTFSNAFQGLAFFLPSIFISSYASSIKLSPSRGTLSLSLLNLTQILGQITMGFISDHISFHLPMTLSPLLSGLSILLLWGFAKTLTPLLTFSMLYGLFAGGYSVLYCRFVTALTDDRATGLWLYSIFEFQRGVGNIAGGLASGLLTRENVEMEAYGLGKYTDLVIFTGVVMLASSFGGVVWFFRENGECLEGDGEALQGGHGSPAGGGFEEIKLGPGSLSHEVLPLVLPSEYRQSGK